jgi:hypothetical protein
MASAVTFEVNDIEAVSDRILVKDMIFGERLSTGGVVMVSDDGKSAGIRHRWAEVYLTGPTQKEVSVGEWVLVKHGRWSRGIKVNNRGEEVTIRLIDNAAILLVSTSPQVDETFTTAMITQSDVRRIEGSLHNDGIQESF